MRRCRRGHVRESCLQFVSEKRVYQMIVISWEEGGRERSTPLQMVRAIRTSEKFFGIVIIRLIPLAHVLIGAFSRDPSAVIAPQTMHDWIRLVSRRSIRAAFGTGCLDLGRSDLW